MGPKRSEAGKLLEKYILSLHASLQFFISKYLINKVSVIIISLFKAEGSEEKWGQ